MHCLFVLLALQVARFNTNRYLFKFALWLVNKLNEIGVEIGTLLNLHCSICDNVTHLVLVFCKGVEIGRNENKSHEIILF